MQIADQRYFRLRDAHHFVDVHAQELASGHPVSAQRDSVVRPAPKRHPVLGQQYRAIRVILAVMFTKETHTQRQNSQISTNARDVIHEPGPEVFVLELMVPPDRYAEDMRGKWVVVVQPQIIEGYRPGGGINIVHQTGEELRRKSFVTDPVTQSLG